MERQNSIESVKDSDPCSSSTSPTSSVASEDESEEENLVSLLKRQSFTTSFQSNKRNSRPLMRKRINPPKRSFKTPQQKNLTPVSRPETAVSLCSIPEDGQTMAKSFSHEEETTFHRTPVTLANGYRPIVPEESINKSYAGSSDTSDDEKIERPSNIWCYLALLISLFKGLLIVLCLIFVFAVYVLITHPPLQQRQHQQESGY